MRKTVINRETNYALVIDKPILELLRITADTPFEIICDGQSLVLTPIRESREESKFQKATKVLHGRFEPTLRKLAQKGCFPRSSHGFSISNRNCVFTRV